MRRFMLSDVRSIVMLGFGLIIAMVPSVSLLAQYPLLPAESNGNTNYEWRPELGGWRDKTTNLVWGYDTKLIGLSSYVYSTSKAAAENYPQMFPFAAQNSLMSAVNHENRAALETDPVRRQQRLNNAALRRADAAACNLAGIDAAKFANWRVPTLAEFQSAFNKGLFARGNGAFNFDAAPFTGYQSLNNAYWTSDPPTSRGRLATVFYPGDGQSRQTSVNSVFFVLVVRTGP